MKGNTIGELEEMILLVVGNLSGESYGNRIRDEIQTTCDRSLSLSAVHTTLHRLEEKKLLTSQYDLGGNERRRGRPKLLFAVTAEGYAHLDRIQEIRNKLWQGLAVRPQTL